MPSKKQPCIDCDNLCSANHQRCRKCYNKYRKEKAQKFCIDCGIKISKQSKRCNKCSGKLRRGIRKNYCIDCGKRISPYTSKRCLSCSTKGKLNGHWKGNKVGLNSLHEWIKNRKPKPEFCEECEKKKPYDLANISGKYKRNINDFEWLCRSCHMKKDGRLKKLLKKGTKSRTRKKKGKLFQCMRCKEFKKPSLFNINKHSKDGLEYSCRDCYNQRNKARIKKVEKKKKDLYVKGKSWEEQAKKTGII